MHHIEARREANLARRTALPGWRWMRGSVAPPGFAPGVTAASDGEPPTAPPGAPAWNASILARAASEAPAMEER
jgi:hypothetical protein